MSPSRGSIPPEIRYERPARDLHIYGLSGCRKAAPVKRTAGPLSGPLPVNAATSGAVAWDETATAIAFRSSDLYP